MKRKFILLTLVIATLIVPANLQAFESTVEEELQTPWEGFGYNQWGFARESDGNTFKPWSDDLWKTTTERILAIKPSLVRLPVIRDWFNKDDDGNNLPIGTYNWDSKYMQAYFKIMDLYKEHDIKVMSGFWGVGYNGEDYKQFYTTDECAQLQADLIEYLFKTKGYDKIITSYAPSNEPLGVGISYEDWSTMIKKLYAELEKRGLPTNFLSGADSWSDWIWKPAQYNADQLSAYDFHNYLNIHPTILTINYIIAPLKRLLQTILQMSINTTIPTNPSMYRKWLPSESLLSTGLLPMLRLIVESTPTNMH